MRTYLFDYDHPYFAVELISSQNGYHFRLFQHLAFDTDEWIQQNQEKIRKLVEALERVSKQNADTLTENSLSSKALAREIGEDERDLKKIHPIISEKNPFR